MRRDLVRALSRPRGHSGRDPAAGSSYTYVGGNGIRIPGSAGDRFLANASCHGVADARCFTIAGADHAPESQCFAYGRDARARSNAARA